MLTQAQINEYNETGAIVVPDVLTPDEVKHLSDVTDGFVQRARGVTGHTDIYDLEDSHTSDSPRVRRIKAAHLHDPAYSALTRHPKILAVLQSLWGTDIRFDTAKLNMKCAGFGAPVEWHQDWAFYPHTNDNLAAVGVMFRVHEIPPWEWAIRAAIARSLRACPGRLRRPARARRRRPRDRSRGHCRA